MTQPEKAARPAARIRSEYTEHTPTLVAMWEKRANDATTAEQAMVQLLYHQLLQLRLIKLILGWALFLIPTIIAIVLIVLSQATDFSDTQHGF